MNNVITYSCFDSSRRCSGSASPATPAPTPSTAQSGNCIVGRGLRLTTCAETSSFRAIGCTCYKCSEVNGYIQLSCSAPFECYNTIYPNYAGEDAPELNTKDYAIICSVFAASSGLFAVIAWLTKPKAPPAPPASEASVSLLQRVWGKVVGSIREYAYEPNVRDDGSFTTFCEFTAFMNPMLSLISQLCCCCMRPRNLPPHYKPPITKMRALAELVDSLCLVTALALLLGTVVNNSEACSSSYNGDRCEMNGVTIDNRVSTTTTSGLCQSVDSEKTTAATIVSTVLTKSVGFACSYAEKTAKDQVRRTRWIQGGRIVLTVGLLAFGFLYSFHIVSKDSGSDAAKRRSKTIAYVLVPSWAADQVTSIATLFGQRLSKILFTCVPKDMRATKVDEATGPVVRPATENIQLQPPAAPANALAGVDVSGVVVKVTTESVPWGDALDTMVRQTEAVTVVWSTPPQHP